MTSPKEDQQPMTTREELDFTTMSGVDLLDYCRDDASKWAEAFCQIKQRQGWSADDIDEGLMVCWFANAIEHASALRCETPKSSATVKLTCSGDGEYRFSRPDAGGGVRIKPLEWEQPDGPEGTAWLGYGTDMCQYYIRFDAETASYWMPGEEPLSDDDDSAEEFFALDDAKAAAQADYESRIFSALSTPPATAESKASVEARLREALIALDERLRSCGSLHTAEDAYDSFYQEIVSEALSAAGDEAKKSEGGVDWDDVRGIAPNATGDLSSEAFIREQRDSWDDQPSAPTAERREIVTRALRSLKEITPKGFANYHNLIDEALSGLAALDGGR